ncbi:MULTISPECIES: response regulator [Photobacterium]|uniref:Chemotaxis protein CheY n=1 Tax=Photobacterium halotolerans TaxID=265726 RepID=A0A0F5VC55_9GAMM|nr:MULTISPECIES: response regulator [Photobacterium]KKC99755.1 chemotaxis protein CheY [Photobacterium halotolerans]UIP29246.1 response regulator [Photobacterium sp. TLY01]
MEMNNLYIEGQKFAADSDQDTEAGSYHQAVILIVEDEFEIVDILSAYLTRSNMRTIHASDGRKALELHSSMKPDLILLDIQMPKMDGWKVLSELRQKSNTPVIMLTAMDQDLDKLMALRIGADDYVVKPFNPAEVVARVQAVLRRTLGINQTDRKNMLRTEPFEVDLESHEIVVNVEGERHALVLTLTEFKLLTHFIRSPKRVFSRVELLNSCLPEGDTLERTIDSHISKIRKKLEVFGIHGIPAGVRGVGYRFRGDQ